MDGCIICGKPSFGYIQRFQSRRKINAYPACWKHLLIADSLIGISQDQVREFLSNMFSIKKGYIPRFKVSSRP